MFAGKHADNAEKYTGGSGRRLKAHYPETRIITNFAISVLLEADPRVRALTPPPPRGNMLALSSTFCDLLSRYASPCLAVGPGLPIAWNPQVFPGRKDPHAHIGSSETHIPACPASPRRKQSCTERGGWGDGEGQSNSEAAQLEPRTPRGRRQGGEGAGRGSWRPTPHEAPEMGTPARPREGCALDPEGPRAPSTRHGAEPPSTPL